MVSDDGEILTNYRREAVEILITSVASSRKREVHTIYRGGGQKKKQGQMPCHLRPEKAV
jgi:hypothetical protein